MANDKSRLHIQKEIPEMGVKINVFGDDPQEAFDLMLSIICLVGEADIPKRPSQANLARLHDDALAKVKTDDDTMPKPSPRPNGNRNPVAGGALNKPCCPDCGNSDSVDLITFTDRETGEHKSRFKCKECGKWLGRAF